MSGLYVYALLGAPPRGEPGAGLDGEPLAVLSCGGLLAVAGEMKAMPSLEAGTLRAHDAVVQRLAESSEAILPVRFGTLVRDAAALAEHLERRAASLHQALALVAGREQMTLRVFGPQPAAVEPASVGDGITGGPGARYLLGRLTAERHRRVVPEIAPLRPTLERLVSAERVERHDQPPLLATVYHLVDRGRSDAYIQAIEAERDALAPVRASASGPWPPYAFAPEALE